MSSAFDWIVEHETLPPDEPGFGEPPGDGRRRRRLPWWAWTSLIALMVAGGLVALLWALGGDTGPLPRPELDQIQAAAGLEVNALRARDAEILNQLAARRDSSGASLEPPVDAWLAASVGEGLAGDVTLLETELVSPQLAKATIELAWDGIPYRLNWYYVPAGDRWVRTGVPPEIGGPAQEISSVHIALTYHQPLPGGDSRFMGQLEAFIIRFCALVACPPEPFQAMLQQNPYQTGYTVRGLGPLTYDFPLLGSLRWPAGGGFEPVLLGSFGRHLAYDLAVRPRLDGLAPENQGALALANYWLAHRLLGLDLLPGTRWLQDAAQRDGTQAALAFIRALGENVGPQRALAVAFRPETVASISQQADYFGWLAAQQTELGPAQIDRAVDPWAPDGRIYADALPEIGRLLHGDGWVMAAPPANSGWMAVTFFHRQDGEWVPGEPPPGDEFAVLDKLVHRTGDRAGQSAIEGARPIAGLEIVDTITSTRVITWTPLTVRSYEALSMTFVPAGGPTSRAVSGELSRIVGVYVQDTRSAAGGRVYFTMNYPGDQAVSAASGSDVLVDALLGWQVEQLLAGPEGSVDLSPLWEGSWRPPRTVDSPDWRPLSFLWVTGAPSDPRERAVLLAHARLVVAYVIETEGPAALTPMIEALAHARSMAAWVTAVKRQPLGQFESEWRAWVIDSRPGD
jgi:hypothetical protein